MQTLLRIYWEFWYNMQTCLINSLSSGWLGPHPQTNVFRMRFVWNPLLDSVSTSWNSEWCLELWDWTIMGMWWKGYQHFWCFVSVDVDVPYKVVTVMLIRETLTNTFMMCWPCFCGQCLLENHSDGLNITADCHMYAISGEAIFDAYSSNLSCQEDDILFDLTHSCQKGLASQYVEGVVDDIILQSSNDSDTVIKFVSLHLIRKAIMHMLW